MADNLRVFLTGTVIYLMAVPFLFGQDINSVQQNSNVDSRPEKTPVHISSLNTLQLTSLAASGKDTSVKENNSEKFRMKKKPWLALLMSAVLPGAGQFYNESYWKVPVIAGLVGYLGYQYYDYNKKYLEYRDLYAESQNQNPPEGDPNLKTLREFYRDQKNDFVWYFMVVYVINLVDAYVDAHLFDFDIEDEKLDRSGSGSKKINLNFRIKL